MRNIAAALHRDRKGAASVEFALVGPLFLILLFAVFQFGLALMANSGMRQAVESGARYATLYPRPTDSKVLDRVRSAGYGMKKGNIRKLTATRGTRAGMPTLTIAMEYQQDLELVFMRIKPVTLTYERTVFQAPES